MGQKAHPVGLRLGITKFWTSNWYARENYSDYLYEDLLIRNYLKKRLDRKSVV